MSTASQAHERDVLPGPVNRESFFAAQARQRRAAKAFGILAIVTLAVIGLPLCIAVAPLLYIVTMPISVVMATIYPNSMWTFAKYGVPLLLPMLTMLAFSHGTYTVHKSATGLTEFHSEFRTDPKQHTFHFGTDPSPPSPPVVAPPPAPAAPPSAAAPVNEDLRLFSADMFNKDLVTGSGSLSGVWPTLILVLLLLALPGSLFLLAVGHFVRKVFRHAGVGGVLLTLGARPPNLMDLAEKRLVDVVGEVAVAAALPSPRVAIIDRKVCGAAANAAAVGWSLQDATIVVTRPLVEELSRDQIQAVIARVIAAIGNGDLQLAFRVLSVFETVGLVQLAINGTHRAAARRTLARFFWLAIRPRTGGTDLSRDAEEQAVMSLLVRATGTPTLPDTGIFVRVLNRLFRLLLAPVLIPLRWTAVTVKAIVGLSARLLAGPVIGALWRRRQMLADALAVQLTRNPDGLAGALERMNEIGTIVPRGAAVRHLFAAWPTRPVRPDVGNDGSGGDEHALVDKMIVALETRLVALQAMGAHARLETGTARAGRSRSGRAALVILVGAVVGVAVIAVVMAIDLVLMSLTLGAAGGLLAGVMAVVKWILE